MCGRWLSVATCVLCSTLAGACGDDADSETGTKRGSACNQSCVGYESAAWGTSQFCDTDEVPDPASTCFNEQRLYCDAVSKTCQNIVREGQACTQLHQCEEGTYCACEPDKSCPCGADGICETGTCVPVKPMGAPCGHYRECVDLVCTGACTTYL